MTEHRDTLILIFARNAKTEAQEKVLHLPKRAGRKLFASLNQETLKKARETKIPYLVWSESMQEGSNFGERITHAVTSVFARGYRHVIIIGNDCPELRSRDIEAASKFLSAGNTVVGPDRDGGAYLLAFTKDNFNASAFSALPWQDPHFCENFLAISGPRVSLLPSYYDLDSFAILKSITNKAGVSQVLKRLFNELITLFRIPATAPQSLTRTLSFPRSSQRRGPPFHALFV